jgi:peptide/nickel transport system substrate-binding protein
MDSRHRRVIHITRRQMLRQIPGAVTLAAALLAACQAPAPSASTVAPPTAQPTSALPPVTQATPTSRPASVATPATAAQPTPASPGGTLTYAVYREPDTLDPTASGLQPAQTIFFSIYDTLVAKAPDNTFQPWLADSWQVAPDGKTYTFKLRKDVKFHDGTPFNAQAVKYTLDRLHDPNAKTRISGAAYDIYESTETPDDFTASIHLSRPWAPMLDGLSYLYRIVSPTAGQKWGQDLGLHPSGTGPFMFQEWVPNSRVSLVRNPDYNWGPAMFSHPGQAYLDGVTFQQIPEAGTRVAALEHNEAQVIEALPSADLERIKADNRYKVLVGPVQGRPYGFSINVRKPPTNDLAVRQAMEYGLNQEALVKTYFGPFQSLGAMTPAHNVLVPTTWGYDKKASEIYSFDPAKAVQLLEGAGWMPAPNGVRMKDGQPLEILLATWENGIVEIMQAQFREIGIDLKIQVLTPVATNEAARREQVHMSPLPSARAEPDVLITNHSRYQGNGNDFTYHSNKHLDDLLDAGASATNNDDRLKIYSEVQMIMMQDAMFLPVYHGDNVSASRAEVSGIQWDRGFFPLLHGVTMKPQQG